MSDQRPDAGSADKPDDDTPGDGLPAAASSQRLLSSSVDMVLAIIVVPVLDLLLVYAVLHPKAGQTFTGDDRRTAYFLYIAALVISALLFVLMDRTGGSPGKRLFKLRTTMVEGIYPAPVVPLLLKYALIFLLLLFNLYGAIVVMVGLLAPLWRSDRRNMFDVLSRLRIVPLASLSPGA